MIVIDEKNRRVTVTDESGEKTYRFDEREAFEAVSAEWIRIGWETKHVYTFSWLGRPIIQLPEDMVRMQEIVHAIKPDLIIETGVAHGGSLVFYAGLCKIMERGRVVGIDVEIRPHNRAAIEAHPLKPWITLVEGSSIDPATFQAVRGLVKPNETVLVVLDSCHTKAHVLAELEAYAGLVTPGSYVVVCDGVMRDLKDAVRSSPDWTWNNPVSALEEFLAVHPEFVEEEPAFAFNESPLDKRLTHWPRGFLKRVG